MTDINTERLSELAARCLEPENLDEGRRKINGIVKNYLRRERDINIFLKIIAVLGGIGLLLGVSLYFRAIFIDTHHPFSTLIAVILLICSVFLMACGVYGRRNIQTRERFFVDRPYDIDLPNCIENLLAKLASGQIEAVLPVAAYSGTSIAALRGSDGNRYDTLLDPSVFKNRYAPILLSDSKWDYPRVWTHKIALDRQIYVILQPANEPIQDGIPLLSSKASPDWPHWMAKIPEGRFDDWFEFVLTIQPQRVGKAGNPVRPWREDKVRKHRIALRAAHDFVVNRAKEGKAVMLEDVRDACKEALEEARAQGLITSLSLESGEKGNSVNWVDKVIGNAETHDYAWIRVTADKFTLSESAELISR